MNTEKAHLAQHDIFDIRFADICNRLIESRLIVAIIFSFSMLIAGYFTYKQPDLYESQLLMQVDSPSSHDASKDILSQLTSGSHSAESAMNQIFLIQSRFILEPVIEELGLNIRTSYVSSSFWNKWLKKNNYTINVKKFEIPDSFLNQKFIIHYDRPSHVRLMDKYNKVIVEGPLGKNLKDSTGLLQFKIQNVDAPLGSLFELHKQSSLSMVSALSSCLKINQMGLGPNQVGGLIQLTFRGSNVSEIMGVLNAIAKTAEKKDNQKRSEEASKLLDFLNQQLPITKGQLQDAERKLNLYRAQSGKIDIKMQSQMLFQKMIGLDAELEKLELKRINMTQKYMPAHPLYQRLMQQVEAIKKQKARVEKELKKQPASDQIAVNLMREVNIKKMLYMVLLGKIQELEVMKAGILSGVHVLAKASLPEVPLSGKGYLFFIAAGVIASLLSMFFVLFRIIMFPKIEDPLWIEKYYQIPNIAIIPFSKEQAESNKYNQNMANDKLMLLADSNSTHLAIEALRSFRTSLQVSLTTSRNNIIGIMGIAPGVGKSFVSANLAYLMALAGKRVLLIDADLRKGTIHKYMNIEASPGLAEVLSGKLSVSDVIKANVHPNLDVISRGTYPKDPAELLMQSEFKELIQHLSSLYDVVIFDTTPVIMVTDALIVGGLAANNYLIMASGKHQPHDVELVMNRLRSVGVNIQGGIFNFNQREHLIKAAYGKYGKYSYYNNEYRAYTAD